MSMNRSEINIEFTTYCDAKCKMCPRDEFKFGWSTMPFDLYKNILDDAVANGVVSLITCGFGEILMDKGVEEKLAYAKTQYPFLKIFVSSTANLIDAKRIHLMKYVDTLRISNYGITKEVHEGVHRGGVKFERVMTNIENILALPDDVRPYIVMSFIILPDNQHQVDQWRTYWEPKVDEVLIWKPHNFGSILDNAFPHKNTPAKRTCGRPFKGEPYVHVSGEVSVCCFDNDRKLVIGDLRKQSLEDILQGEKLRRIQEIHESGQFDSSDLICKNCDQVTDRKDALIYASNKERKVGVLMGHPDMITNVGEIADVIGNDRQQVSILHQESGRP